MVSFPCDVAGKRKQFYERGHLFRDVQFIPKECLEFDKNLFFVQMLDERGPNKSICFIIRH